ncbi:MAG: Hsp20/alpha crystallin family protein [Candidatus Hodarchaeales archaeon]|jgi:HSP20 family protein
MALAVRVRNPFWYHRTHVPARDRVYAPLTDLIETKDEFVIKVNLPGISKDELDVQSTSEYIEIKAEYKEKETDDNKDEIKYRERYAFKYNRKIVLPTLVEPSEAKIKLENGVLTINLPKSEKTKAIKLLPE